VGDRRGRRCAAAPTPHRAEALATAKALRDAGWNFSVGLGQINVGNFERLGLTVESAFEPCANLAAMQTVLGRVLRPRERHRIAKAVDQMALRQALSCYYSGNFATGFRHGYVRKVVVAARAVPTAQPKEKV
jgi:type IV secretion system protein VirB1